MSIYRVELDDGRVLRIEVDGDTPPTEEDIIQYLAFINPQKIVLLGCAEVDEDSIVLTEHEQAEKNFLKEFVFTEEGN